MSETRTVPREPDEILLACERAHDGALAHEKRAESHADTAVVACIVALVGAYVCYRAVQELKLDLATLSGAKS